jgi:hypothetical protein
MGSKQLAAESEQRKDSGQETVGRGQETVGIRQWVGSKQWAFFPGYPYFKANNSLSFRFEASILKRKTQTEANISFIHFEVNILKRIEAKIFK